MEFVNYSPIGLLLLALLGVLAWRSRAKLHRRTAAFADPIILPKLIGWAAAIQYTQSRRELLSLLAILFLMIAAFRPQWGFKWTEQQARGVDIVLAVDVSQSMLATDVSPNRLERAKRKIRDLLTRLRGDRVALVAFAGAAFIESPLTNNYSTFRSFLNLLSPDFIPAPGSNFEEALRASLKAFGEQASRGLSPEAGGSRASRAILLITDGEELEGDLDQIKAELAAAGIRVYVLGVGTPDGGPIPNRGGFKRDPSGQVVVSRLNDDFLGDLATGMGGIYVRSISSDRDLQALYDDGIKAQLADGEFGDTKIKEPNEFYQVPLAIGLLLMLFQIFSLRGGTVLNGSRKTGIGLAGSMILLASILIPNLAAAETREPAESPELNTQLEKLGATASRALEKGEFSSALEDFSKANSEAPSEDKYDPRFVIGEGASLYRMRQFKDAQEKFDLAAKLARDARMQADAIYNSANSILQQGRTAEAVKRYEQAQQLAPNDIDIKNNLEFARKLLEEQKKQNKQQEEKKDQQKNPEQKQEQEREQSESKSGDQNKESEQQSKQNQNNSKQEQESKEQQQNSSEQKSDQKSDPKESDKSQQQDGQQQKDSQPQSQQGADAQSESTGESKPEEDKQVGQNGTGEKPEDQNDSEKEKQGEGDGAGAVQPTEPEQPAESDQEQSAAKLTRPVQALLDSVKDNRDILKQYRLKQVQRERQGRSLSGNGRDW